MKAQSSQLERLFSSVPGPNEFVFQQKYLNPLILDETLNLDNLSQAKKLDSELGKEFIESLLSVVNEVSILEANVDFEVIIALKNKLEQLYLQSSRLGGDQTEHKKSIITLINVMMKSLWQQAKDDDEALEKLTDEEIARELHFDLLESRLIAEVLSEDELLDIYSLVSILLFSEQSMIEKIISLFPNELQIEIYEMCLKIQKNTGELSQEQLTLINENTIFIKSLLNQN